jgi:uncharacterized RDD family membrane protein YckC
MKCPKCQYIGFDNGDRCRNCGYEFSLSVDVAAALDLPIQTGNEPEGPLADLSLAELDSALTEPPPAPSPPEPRSPGSHIGAAEASRRAAAPARRQTTAGLDLPLFRDRPIDDDAPLVTPSATPRAPLAVRRGTPGMPKGRGRDDTPEPGIGLEELPRVVTPVAPRAGPAAGAGQPVSPEPRPLDAAGPGARLLAAAIDAVILGSITFAVLHFTLQLTRLGFEDLDLLPKVPLVTFLLLLNGGYFVTLTAAGGQTIGKMATGIRVVSADLEGRALQRVPLGHAVLRVASYAISLLPAGLGYLPALVGQDRRALHDRLADTRVIRL